MPGAIDRGLYPFFTVESKVRNRLEVVKKLEYSYLNYLYYIA
jgi:hypothetical protein